MGNDWIDLDINKLLHITGKKKLSSYLTQFYVKFILLYEFPRIF